MMKDEEYISNYFKEALTPEEMKQFDQKIQQDPAFAEAVAFYCSTLQEIKDQLAEEKKKRFREIYEQQNHLSKLRPIRRLWPYWSAAAVITAIVLGFYLFGTTSSPRQMADSYMQEKLQTLSVTMGTENSLQKGRRLYNEGKFTEALGQFENIIKTDTGDTEAKINAGIASLKLQQYDKAIEYFKQVENTTLYSNPGKFYQALTLMKRSSPNDKQEARILLEQVVQNDLEGREEAEEWLKEW
jgi:tetratricopeptide (TPR) repeat protein